jgi:iron complex transport system permease protein
MTGGALVVLADLIGRTAFAPVEIPCGIITSIVGAPYFLYLLYRSRNQ